MRNDFRSLFLADYFSKQCAERLDRRFVELSEIENVKVGEFTRLSESLRIALRDYAQIAQGRLSQLLFRALTYVTEHPVSRRYSSIAIGALRFGKHLL